MNGDAVRPRLKHRGGEFAGVRVTGISGVPDQRDFVEVNTKLYHGAGHYQGVAHRATRCTDRMMMGLTGTS